MPQPSPPASTAAEADVPLTRVSSPVLAARSDEMALLARAVGSPPSIVMLEGEAGVGKTRLVQELSASLAAEGRRVLTGHCHPMPEPFPLGPILEAVRSLGADLSRLSLTALAGALVPVLPEFADRLPPPPGPLGDRAMERHRLWRALIEVLDAAAPVVVALEDVHWADEATLQFLAFLAAQQPAGVALVLTSRVEDLPASPPLRTLSARLPSSTSPLRIRLNPLSPEDVKVVIGAILDTDHVSDEFATYLHERTAGIPLAVEEVLRLLVDREDIVRWRGQWARRALEQVEVPAGIRDSLLERLARLAPDARGIVEAAAVLAEPASEAVLSDVAGIPAARAAKALEAAMASGVLQPEDDGYACRHALAAQAVYDAIAMPRRRHLHRRAAHALEAKVSAEVVRGPRAATRLAHHWKEAGEPGPWVRWAEEAATQADAFGDPGAAVALLLGAIAAPGLDAPTRGRLALALSDAAIVSLSQAGVAEIVHDVVTTDDLSPAVRGRLRINLGSLLHQAGDASAAHEQFALAVPDLQDRPELLARVTVALALPWVADNDLKHHMAWLDRAAKLADDLPPDLKTTLLADRASILVAVGDKGGWPAIPPPPAPGANLRFLQDRSRLCTNLAINAFYLGYDDRAASFMGEGLRMSAQTGYLRVSPALHTVELLLDWTGGRWDDLEAAAREVIDTRPDIPSLVQVTMVLGHITLARGEASAAEHLLMEVADQARRCGAMPVFGAASAGVARARLAEGDVAGACAHSLAALADLAAKGIWCWTDGILPTAVAALVARGSVDEAGDWCRRLGAGLRGRDAPAARAAALCCRAEIAAACDNRTEAAALFAKAAAAWRRLGRPYGEALASEGQARCLLEAELEAGTVAATGALSIFQGLGASWDEARVRRLLRQHAVVVSYPRRGGRRSYGDALSPREHEVVELASTGLTSTRIANRLFLSPRTVDHHLARALQKLGLSSRRELVEARDVDLAKEQIR